MTVIVSVIFSTITVIIITHRLFDNFMDELEKTDEHFIREIEQVKIETLRAIKNIRS
ncbi:hypothetical protein [Sporosarcina sp. E16_8]|uniref:hypothetical protein n=1 Tax=Sporosarcina sp. E16_8 TaxID=2789295 RepID=UPI001A91444C|nr:hypothetical protein [Sporosarcina sp. E16_8]MBO0586481.1 hypothetical protein [Sporosarcina sp. E16_8]